jgi:hypothetical protein
MNATASRLALVAGLLVMTGCLSVQQTELPGSYVAEYDFGTDTLTLKPDGTFMQDIDIHQGDRISSTGRWEYRLDDTGFGEVWLTGCVIVDDGFGRLREPFEKGNCVESVERSYLFGRPRLGVSDMHPYVKRE